MLLIVIINIETILTPGGGVASIEHTTVNGFYHPIQIIASPKTITLGENVSIDGFIAIAQANVPVTILHRHHEETEWHTLDTATGEQGSYSYLWTPEKKRELSREEHCYHIRR